MGSQGQNFAINSKEQQLLLGSFKGDDEETSRQCMCFKHFNEKIKNCLNGIEDFAKKAWEMGRSDPRKFIFAVKMGMALSFVSLLICWKGLDEDLAQYSIWAILTVIVMFEYSIGATFIKGFNRVLGTVCAGILAFSFAELSMLAGEWEDVVIVSSIFITGTCSSYLKLYPTMKPYEYGFRVFILTYCILMVAGNRTREYTEAVLTRLFLIGVGAGVCLVVNVFIYPIWAGDSLHSLVVKNFEDVATSLEGCVNGYLKCVEYERVPSKIISLQAYDDPLYNGYRSVIESTGKEDTLLGFAVWEPPHGRFRMFKYPWSSFVKVSAALRHCAFTVMALHGCILSEIQAPAENRLVFHNNLKEVGAEGAKFLREIGKKVDKMEKLSCGDILNEVHEAAYKLQRQIDQMSYLLVNSESWEAAKQQRNQFQEQSENRSTHNENMQLRFKSLSEHVLDASSFPAWTPYPPANESPAATTMFRKQASWPSHLSLDMNAGNKEGMCKSYESASALSLATFASLLIEFVARLQNVVDSFEELSEKANFAEPALNSSIDKNGVGFCIKLFRCCGFSN